MNRSSFGLKMLVALGLATIAAGCASRPNPGERPDFRGDASDVLTITVRNHQLDEARLWLWVDGQRRRLGSVRGNTNETFRFPIANIAVIHLEFDLVLGMHCVTANASLGPGDQIEATIPSNLRMMAASCRQRSPTGAGLQ